MNIQIKRIHQLIILFELILVLQKLGIIQIIYIYWIYFKFILKIKQKKTNFLPKLNSFDSNLQSESYFKVKNNSIESYKKSKLFD